MVYLVLGLILLKYFKDIWAKNEIRYMAMKIGMNVSRLSGQRLGVGRYLEYMLKCWSRMLVPGEEVHAYLRNDVPSESVSHLNLSPSIELRKVGPKLPGLLWENFSLPLEARNVDAFFGPSYSLPLVVPMSCKRVVATHSVNEVQPGAHESWADLAHAKWNELSARSADAVIVPCNSTADLVTNRYGVPRKKIVIIPQGADETFRPLDDPNLVRQTRIDFVGEDVPYILFVGKLSIRRNIPNLIAAFARVKKANRLPHKLLLVGPNHRGLPLARICSELGVSSDVVQTDGKFAHHEELIRIYNGAELFVHPSWFEGWSMTTVEALACGTATIAADRGGLGDVARGRAYMIKEPTVEALQTALEKVLLNKDFRQELKQLARKPVSGLTWEDTTRQTLDVIRNVANGLS